MTTDPAGQYWCPYMSMGNNPLRIVDSDGRHGDDYIYTDANGKIVKIERNDLPNRFFDYETKNEYCFHDIDDLSYANFDVGERLFLRITDAQITTIGENAGTADILGEVIYKSYSKWDFALNVLYHAERRAGMYPVKIQDKGTILRRETMDGGYIRFGDSFELYNTMDAGNYLWGYMMRRSGFSLTLALRGANANEFFTRLKMDTDADQEAIKNGYNRPYYYTDPNYIDGSTNPNHIYSIDGYTGCR